MRSYELMPGKCETCAFGKEANGVILCQLGGQRECIPGMTAYKFIDGPSETPPNKIIIPQTNGDRIRSMSNEKLAEFLEENNCPPGMDGVARCPARCSICWLNWLNAEAKEEE